MIRISNIKIDIEKDTDDYLIEKVSKILRINKDSIFNYKIIKKSLDARKKDEIHYVYTVDLECTNEDKLLNNKDVTISINEKYKFTPTGTKKEDYRPIIVGSGPSGLFCAYMLSLNGYKPLIIERGEKIEDRIKTVENFFETNKLNEESNVQFGEGGAGTFSDGKLNTGIKDKLHRIDFVLETFVENGAPQEITYLNRPHIGTNILRKVIINLRNKIISLGGEFRYNTKLTNLIIENNELKEIEVNNNEIIPCNNLFLCIGHSSRDTFNLLMNKELNIEAKSFAVGVRVSHSQEKINESMYGENYKLLPPAYYKLTYTTKDNRGVYSFCMCPGGYVVNSSSENNHLVVNGMSNYERESNTANSAIVVTVSPKDFGNNILSGIEFQRKLEEKAYNLGEGNIPVQSYVDFKNNTKSTSINEYINVKGKYTLSNLVEILPDYITKSIIEGMDYFSTKIKGYNDPDTNLYGVETRTSSPIRIVRDEVGLSNIKGIYPTGEGAGYAGGITSSAVDGIKQAENYMKIYKSN